MNQLPEGYKEIRSVNLGKDKKTFIVINIFGEYTKDCVNL